MPRPFRVLTRRAGPLGLALTFYDLWRRLPPAQRKQLLEATRKHGPRIAAKAMKARKRPRG